MYAIYHFKLPNKTSFIDIRKTHYDSRLIHDLVKQKHYKKFAKQKDKIKVELLEVIPDLKELPKMERYIKKKMLFQEWNQKLGLNELPTLEPPIHPQAEVVETKHQEPQHPTHDVFTQIF